MSLSGERRRHLQGLGLRALVKRRYGESASAGARTVRFAGGSALITEADGMSVAAAFADDPSGLGAAIDAATREGADRLLFFSELNSADVARRATAFALETIVIDPDGDLQQLAPSLPVRSQPMPPELAASRELLQRAGLEVVWDHGVLLGEWLGLEVARAALGDDGVVLDVGVGKHDREASRMLYPEGPDDAAISAARATVAALRRVDAPPHPANQLEPERWLRAVVVQRPSVLGLGDLVPAEAPVARHNLRERGVAPALGDGVVVVFSVGIDPDLVAQAADSRLHLAPDADLVIAVPEGDDHPLLHRLAALLVRPARVITVPADWRAS